MLTQLERNFLGSNCLLWKSGQLSPTQPTVCDKRQRERINLLTEQTISWIIYLLNLLTEFLPSCRAKYQRKHFRTTMKKHQLPQFSAGTEFIVFQFAGESQSTPFVCSCFHHGEITHIWRLFNPQGSAYLQRYPPYYSALQPVAQPQLCNLQM